MVLPFFVTITDGSDQFSDYMSLQLGDPTSHSQVVLTGEFSTADGDASQLGIPNSPEGKISTEKTFHDLVSVRQDYAQPTLTSDLNEYDLSEFSDGTKNDSGEQFFFFF